MEHGPTRDKILDSFKVMNAQIDQTVLRARADLQSGLALEDLIAGGGAEFATTMTVEGLAHAIICRILWEAKKPVPKPRKKTAVPAKRPRRPVTLELRDVPQAGNYDISEVGNE